MRDTRPLSEQAITLLKKRYLKPGEDWAALCRRVAKFAANNEAEEEQFYHLLYTRVLLPNTPCLVNAGTKDPQVSACFLLPIEDSLNSIFKTLHNAALIYQAAGGVGINLTPLRPEGFPLSRGGVSSGPISFLRIFNEMTEQIKQGSMRRGAGIALLQVDHPDIVDFVKCKNVEGTLANFNISVMVTHEFMRLLKTAPKTIWCTRFNGREYWLERNYADLTQDGTWWDANYIPREHDATAYSVQDIWDLICEQAWKNGEPGLIFIDTAREKDPGVDGCNPCQPGFATVLTPDGIRTFDDIDVGSTIWSGRQWTKVVRKIYTGVKSVREFRTSGGTFIGTDNHYVCNHGAKIEVSKTTHVDNCTGPFEIPDVSVYPDFQDVLDGLVFGDGSYHAASKTIILDIGQNDSEYFIGQNDSEYFQSEISGLIQDNLRVHGDRTYRVKTTLQPYELPPTYKRSIPNRFFTGTTAKVCMFLRGLYSANGSVVDNRITLKASSFAVIQQVQQMLSAVGISSYYTTNKARLTTFKNGEYLCKESYDLNITTDREKFCNLIDFIQHYKRDKIVIKSSNKYKQSYEIQSVIDIALCDVYDITVDAPEHTYWTGGLLVSNCGEVIMEPYEACVLASIDVSRFVPENSTGYDFKELADVAATGCLFLNRLVDKGHFPLPEIAEKVRTNRRIGLGIMGLADALLLQQIRYGDSHSLDFAMAVAKTITAAAAGLSKLEGFENRTVTCIAPTGSISQIAGCSSGCEPVYDWVTKQTRVDFGVQEVTHPLAAQYKSLKNLPPHFVTALQVLPEDHVLMQAALQEQIDGSISKTINLPHDATVDDIDVAYEMAYDTKCKGVTIYRDKSREVQVLSQATSTTTPPTCKEQSELSEEEEQILDEDDLVETDDNYWEAFLSELGLPRERPYCLEGFTFKLKLDMGGKLENTYVTVTTVDNRPYEIFVYGNVRDADQIIAQYIDTVSRLISLSLRSGVPLDTVVTQLRKVPCSHIFSIPHKLADILQEFQSDITVEQKYIPEEKAASQAGLKSEACPACQHVYTLIRSEGCLKCTDCGWSKCG